MPVVFKLSSASHIPDMPQITHDNTDAPPRLKMFLNYGTLHNLPAWSTWPKLQGGEAMAYLKGFGFEGVQDADASVVRAEGLESAGSGRIDFTHEAGPLARKLKDAGHGSATVHVGYGFEDDDETDRLVDSVLAASAKTGLPIFIETHRATITQDPWRTIQITKRRPDVRFNADFSHYYTGQELIYGDFPGKLDQMQPIFDRVRFMHGRIGSPGSIQVDIADGHSPIPLVYSPRDFLADFRTMWTRAMSGFLRHAVPGDYLIFAPEILAPFIYYARVFPGPDGQLREESDRWQQALVYARIARECFAAAKGL